MTKTIKIVAMTLFATLSLVAGQGTTYHQDHRSTPREVTQPNFVNPDGRDQQSLAWLYLEKHSGLFDLNLNALELDEVRTSLLGKHYYFQQFIEGLPIDGGQIVVSIDAAGDQVYRVSNNTFPVAQTQVAKIILSVDDAYDLAWQELKVHGELIEMPTASLLLIPEKETVRLVYRTQIATEAPYGYWQIELDAVTGEIRSRSHYDLARRPHTEHEAYNGPIDNRQSSSARMQSRLDYQAQIRAQRNKNALLANGTGVTFDPDPRTTLLDDDLQDESAAAAFTAAYFTRNLLDITENAGTYSLVGPWIEIIDFEPPNTPPSTTNDGNWTAIRGDNAFNDSMTYFHIDQNQRYIQSLGFSGTNGIQEVSIGTDSDGFNGSDNSHYLSGSNRMAFGHGCVDDNEDQFVILHEYGHAIHYSINNNWGGGDTGAMGEGFGDYWAASYRNSTPNGPAYHPEWAFPWDAHGTGNMCWAGRILNAFGAQYVHTTTYGAHTGIPGGFVSDELWSTPLFQSLLEILIQGGTREESDMIILEAHFGIAPGPKMRDMANRIIATAETLFPDGVHRQIFISKFLVHNIVDIQAVQLAFGDATFTNTGPNGVPDPGEMVNAAIRIDNNGTLGANTVTATLSTSAPMVTVTAATSAYPDIGSGGSASNLTDFTIQIDPAFPCGDPIDFTLSVGFVDDTRRPATNLNFSIHVGEPLGADQGISPNLPIMDNQTTTSMMTVTGTSANVTANFNVDVNISHTSIGELTVELESPDGTIVRLHDGTGGTTNDIIGNYPGTLTPAEPLSGFLGDTLDGTWILTVADGAGGNTGTVNSWAIEDLSGYVCELIDPCTFLTFAEVMALWAEANAVYDFDLSGQIDVGDLTSLMSQCP